MPDPADPGTGGFLFLCLCSFLFLFLRLILFFFLFLLPHRVQDLVFFRAQVTKNTSETFGNRAKTGVFPAGFPLKKLRCKNCAFQSFEKFLKKFEKAFEKSAERVSKMRSRFFKFFQTFFKSPLIFLDPHPFRSKNQSKSSNPAPFSTPHPQPACGKHGYAARKHPAAAHVCMRRCGVCVPQTGG